MWRKKSIAATCSVLIEEDERVKILVTGGAGFIGFHSSRRLLAAGHEIVGIDNLNDYYDVGLKQARLALLSEHPNFAFFQLDLADREGIAKLFREQNFDIVLHLGAQAGVRYSLENPFAYIDSNITGTMTVLEGCRHNEIKHLIYASSSSVYGANSKQPFSTDDRVDSPVSLYAATKKSDEMLCEAYARLYGFPITGLRFFTVYGPWGRPDMAYFKFADSILSGRSIDIYNNGEMSRDFTYIDDIVSGIFSIVTQGPVSVKKPHSIYNLGNNTPEPLMNLVGFLEESLGVEARVNFLPMQPGDVISTYADISATQRDYGFVPGTTLREGISKFSEWYLKYRALRSH